MSKNISITLSEDESLVLFEFFSRFEESDEFKLRHNAEFLAFSRISSQLDKVLVEPFKPEYAELLEAAQNRVALGYEGVAPGVITSKIEPI